MHELLYRVEYRQTMHLMKLCARTEDFLSVRDDRAITLDLRGPRPEISLSRLLSSMALQSCWNTTGAL
jgi:hypothetical protein